MEYLSNELLSLIFNYLPKRAIIECSKVSKNWHQLTLTPQYYSTINIYTPEQLKKFFQLANDYYTRLISNKPVGYYVHHLNLHIYNVTIYTLSDILELFPNIQDIDGLFFDNSDFVEVVEPYLNTRLRHLTQFSLWYTNLNENWENFINDKVTLLELCVDTLYTRDKLDIISLMFQQLQQPEEEAEFNYPPSKSPKSILSNQVRIKKIGEEKRKPMHFNDTRIRFERDFNEEEEDREVITYSSKIIQLPTLNHLVTLKLQFFSYVEYKESSIYEFDERTFETIHQSCALLEHLEMDGFNMNISVDYEMILRKLKDEKKRTTIENTPIPSSPNLAMNLKNFHFTEGVLHDPRCYTYFLNKYPQLESLKLNLKWYRRSKFNLRKNVPFKLALFDLISQSSCLKSLAFSICCFNSSDQIIRCTDEYWPTFEFNNWINDHPNQLTSLTYPYDIATIGIDYVEGEYDNNNNNEKVDLNMGHRIVQTNYLNHLKYLSLVIQECTQSTLSYLTNKGQVASFSLEELEVKMGYGMSNDNYSFYIYRWLDAFPNLLKLKLINAQVIKDVPSKTKNPFACGRSGGIKNDNVKKEKKEKGRIMNDNRSDDDNQVKTYKLQELYLQDCVIYFKHGFLSFSKKCPHITKLTFDIVKYAFFDWQQKGEYQEENPVTETTLDLSNMYDLHYLSIYGFKFTPWFGELFYDPPTVDIVNIKEIGYCKREFQPPKQQLLTFFESDSFIFKPPFPHTLNIICYSVFDVNFL